MEIILEYDLEIPEVGEYSEKLGYLEDLGVAPGDVWGIWNHEKAQFDLEMFYDISLKFIVGSNKGDYKILNSGQKLEKICHTRKVTTSLGNSNPMISLK